MNYLKRHEKKFNWWLLFFVIVSLVLVLYALNSIGEYTSIAKLVVASIPFIILVLISILWAAKSDKGRTFKVIAGVVTGAVSSILIYSVYWNEAVEWVEETEETITNVIFGLILIVSAIITNAASKGGDA